MGSRSQYDIVVVGAGPAGSLTAAYLSAGGLKTLIVEKMEFLRPRVGEFLSPRARAAINKSGILEAGWEKDHAEAWEFVSAWGPSATAARHYLYNPHGHALVLDRARFDQSLAAAAQRAGATLLTNARVSSATRSANSWHLILRENGSEARLICSFLILCSGRLGGRMRCLQTRRHHVDKLVCLGLRMSNYRGDRRPLIEAYDHGWAYSVPLPSGHLMVNLCTEAGSRPHRRLSKSLVSLLDEIAACPLTRSRLLQADPADREGVETFVTDASSAYTRPLAGPGWCLAGDCAQSMDPLSSIGIEQAAKHAELIWQGISSSSSINSVELDAYRLHLDTSYKSYLAARAQTYGTERRWRTPFWLRRCEMTESLDDGVGG